jgi:hypothetical protein
MGVPRFISLDGGNFMEHVGSFSVDELGVLMWFNPILGKLHHMARTMGIFTPMSWNITKNFGEMYSLITRTALLSR